MINAENKDNPHLRVECECGDFRHTLYIETWDEERWDEIQKLYFVGITGHPTSFREKIKGIISLLRGEYDSVDVVITERDMKRIVEFINERADIVDFVINLSDYRVRDFQVENKHEMFKYYIMYAIVGACAGKIHDVVNEEYSSIPLAASKEVDRITEMAKKFRLGEFCREIPIGKEIRTLMELRGYFREQSRHMYYRALHGGEIKVSIEDQMVKEILKELYKMCLETNNLIKFRLRIYLLGEDFNNNQEKVIKEIKEELEEIGFEIWVEHRRIDR